MSTKNYKGVFHSFLPDKGYGFIAPYWGNGNTNKNIFFSFAETKNGKCYIPALANKEERTEHVGKKGTKTVLPNKPQIVFFNIEVNNNKLIAVNLRDEQHITIEESEDADANSENPSLKQLLHPEATEVDLMVKAEAPAPKNAPMSLEQLEAACDHSKKPKVAPIQQVQPQEEDECAPEEEEPIDNLPKEEPRLSIYTEEELRELEEQEEEEVEEEEEVNYDDYDDYDDYYED